MESHTIAIQISHELIEFSIKASILSFIRAKKNSDSESRMRFIFYGRYEALLIDFEYIIIIMKYY